MGGKESKDSQNNVPTSVTDQLVDACVSNNVAEVRRLLSRPSSVPPTTKNNFGNPVLHMAAARGYVEIIDLLINAGCPVDLVSEDLESDLLGSHALHVVGAVAQKGLATEQVADISLRTVQCLVGHKADVNAKTATGNTVLHRMIALNYRRAVNFLLEQPQTRVTIANDDGKSAAELARELHSGRPEWAPTLQMLAKRESERAL
eukprot:gnl/Spiro4/2857_TR1401_c0_g1_i1.p1 gnl/Spiro4/2857_TR1401_c0_g1~~gnl/Spiro4/2857_TR1401_c0_g1_i1.p1  ORF type:complete len:204 (+),score=44.03 gnl/Spiro4/2857_TR1401_c0_g1_i1:60-671(+)